MRLTLKSDDSGDGVTITSFHRRRRLGQWGVCLQAPLVKSQSKCINTAHAHLQTLEIQMPEMTGGCLCGHVRYRIAVEPVVSRICWCRDCQHISSNGTVNAIFPSAGIEITGSPAEYTSKADSGNQVRRRFCGQCGCHLFADSTGRPGLTVVRVGTLDDPSLVRPSANIWSASAPAWACLDGGLDRIERQPAPLRPPSTAA